MPAAMKAIPAERKTYIRKLAVRIDRRIWPIQSEMRPLTPKERCYLRVCLQRLIYGKGKGETTDG